MIYKECTIDAETMRCVACGMTVATVPTYRRCVADEPPTDSMPTRAAPGFLDKLRNFATAAAGHVAAGMPMASDEEIIRRHDLCLACEHLQNDACNLCGCPVARVRGYVSKLSWADSECPAGKWGKAPSA